MMPRDVPDEFRGRLTAWYKFFWLWWGVHYFLGIVGMVSAILAAVASVQPNLLPGYPAIPGIVSAVFVSLLTFLRPSHPARGYTEAWRKLSGACNRYRFEQEFTLRDLQNAVDEGERLIKESEPF